MKSLDAKLASLHAGPGTAEDFILADAKDADMAFGIGAPGVDPATGRLRSLADYRDQIREITQQGLVDIMLMSASTGALLCVEERIFEGSAVTPAIRANDSSDIHVLTGGSSPAGPSRPFRTPTTEQLRHGAGADLALYSLTPANDAQIDVAALQEYRHFRSEAQLEGVRHFLEVFSPLPEASVSGDIGRFMGDFVARLLAGVPGSDRPLLLKMPYYGPRAMRELSHYDPHLVPGILGGTSGTTFDAFFLLEDARRNGARAAIFGRRIKDSEHPLTFVAHLRRIADGEIGAGEACRAYRADLERLRVTPRRSLDEDLQLTQHWGP